MALPQIPRVDREQAITDLIEALALQEAAIASLINAEAGKVDALVASGIPAANNLSEVDSFQAAVVGVLQLVAQKGQASNQQMELLYRMMAPREA